MGRFPARFLRGLSLTPASPKAARWPRRSLEVRRSSSPPRRPSARARRGRGHPCHRSGVPGASPGRRRACGAALDVVPGPAGSPDSGPDRTAISCRRARVAGPDIWPMAPEEAGSGTHGGNRSRTPGDRDSLVAGRAPARHATHRPDPCRGRRRQPVDDRAAPLRAASGHHALERRCGSCTPRGGPANPRSRRVEDARRTTVRGTKVRGAKVQRAAPARSKCNEAVGHARSIPCTLDRRSPLAAGDPWDDQSRILRGTPRARHRGTSGHVSSGHRAGLGDMGRLEGKWRRLRRRHSSSRRDALHLQPQQQGARGSR